MPSSKPPNSYEFINEWNRVDFIERETMLRIRQFEAIQKGLPPFIATDKSLRNRLFLGDHLVNLKIEDWERYIEKAIKDSSLLPKQLVPFYEYCLGEMKIGWDSHLIKCRNPMCKKEYLKKVAYMEKQIEELKPEQPTNNLEESNSNP